MAKIPFNIKYRSQIESGEYKVIDPFGYVLTLKDIINDVWYFSLRYPNTDYETERIYDHPENHLFLITPEPELSEFEKAVGLEIFDEPFDERHIKVIKEESAKLLALAREQFIKDGYVIEKKAFYDAVENISDKHRAEMSVEYSIHCKIEDGTRHAIMNWEAFQKVAQKFIDIGKAEALKDLPRWRKCAPTHRDSGTPPAWIVRFDVEREGNESKIVHNGYYIDFGSLEKLPGFNE